VQEYLERQAQKAEKRGAASRRSRSAVSEDDYSVRADEQSTKSSRGKRKAMDQEEEIDDHSDDDQESPSASRKRRKMFVLSRIRFFPFQNH
jgi:hypothetical protein